MNGGVAVAAIGLALFLDAAVETFWAGSPVRWWVAGGAVLYLVATAATWRSTIGWRGRLAIAGVGLSALVAVTAWGPGGLSDGVRLAGQSTPRVLAALAALGVVLAGLGAIRLGIVPLPIRVAVGAIAAYGAAGFVLGAVSGTPFAAMLGGHSVWQRLPTFLQGAFLGGFIVLPLGLVAAVVKAGLRRPAAASLRADVWQIAAIAASLAIALAGLPLRSTPAGSSQAAAAPESTAPQTLAARLGIDPGAPRLSPAELNAALANSLKAIEDGEREAPRDRWDPAYVAKALGSDPQRIFAWVQANTFWIPYRGLLRGPVGVLMDRLGNSLDRAALLAILLRQSGRTVRLANGTLTLEQTVPLLRQLLLPRYAALTAAPLQSLEGTQLTNAAAEYQLDAGSLQRLSKAEATLAARKYERLSQHVPDQTDRIAAAVGRGPEGQAAAAFTRAQQILQDHWWVQVFERGTWQDVDLVAQVPGTLLTNATRIVELDAFPDELRQQLTVSVIAEQWAEGTLKKNVALRHTLKLSQLIGSPITLRLIPTKWPTEFPPSGMTLPEGLRKVALDQHEWIPSLVIGTNAVTQMVIRDTGEVVPPSDPTAQLGGAIGGKASGLAKAFENALGPGPSAPAMTGDPPRILTSVSIEYEIQKPTEPAQKIRRSLFDLIGPAARARTGFRPSMTGDRVLTRNLALMRDTEILPMVCRFAPEYVSHLAAQSVLANRELLTQLVQGTFPDDTAHLQDLAKRMAALPSRLYGLALARFHWSRFSEDIFIETPNILTRHTFLTPGQQGYTLVEATDIVANEIGVGALADDLFAVRLEQGILDTSAEALLASDEPNASNAAWAFAASHEWTTLRGPADPRLASLRLHEDVRQRIAEDLSAGYVVVAPRTPVAVGAAAFSGWWRVNPQTGQTLGMGSTGWGQEYVEYLVTTALSIELWMFWTFFFCRLGGGSIAACREKAINAGIFAALFSLLSFLSPAIVLPKVGPGPKLPGLGGPGPKSPNQTQPLDPLPFEKTKPSDLGAGPGPAPSPGPGPTPSPTPGPGPAPGPGGGSRPGWLNWGESWPGPFSGGSWPKSTPPPAPSYNPAPPSYSPPRPTPNSPPPIDNSGKPGFLQWGQRAGGQPEPAVQPPAPSGGAGTVNPGTAGPSGTLPAGPPGPGGTLPCSPSVPCATTGVVKVQLGMNGTLNTLAQKGGS